MSDFEIHKLNIPGYQERPVPNRFFRQAGQAASLALVLPGLRYSCDAPLLYYPTKLLLQRRADVLQLQTDYTNAEFQNSSRREQASWLAEDGRAALQTGQKQRDYPLLILIGKSIGTLVMAHLITSDIATQATTIWLTPLLHQPRVVEAALRCQGPAMFIAGSGDPTFDSQALARIQSITHARTLVIDGANHSLETSDDAFQSLNHLTALIQNIADFLDTRS